MSTRRSFIESSAGVPVFATAGSVLAEETTPAASTTTDMGVVFGEVDGQTLRVDIYRPAARDESQPAVILMFGGGMRVGERGWMADAGQGLAEAGYVAFSIDYRLFDGGIQNLWPVQLDDAQRAVRWVRANAATYGVDPERIASYGHSSGAQLAAFLGTRETRDDSDKTLAGISSRVACVVDMAGGMDMTIPEADPEFNAYVAAILGGSIESPPDEAAYLDFSPISFVDDKAAPFLILQGLEDSAPRISNSREMQAALHEVGVEVIHCEFPGVDHFAWDWAHAGVWTLAFLGYNLHPEE